MNNPTFFLNEENKKLFDAGIILPIMEQFYTIQGEGFHTGKPAYFIRVGGCDVGCHWCDVKESWDPTLHPLTQIDALLIDALKHPSNSVVITGGEPSNYNLTYLTKIFSEKKLLLHLETSGAFEITGNWHWICLSPKKNMPPLNSSYNKANELKVIIYNKNDFEWAEKNAQKVKDNCILYLQPEWSNRNKTIPLITEYVMQNPKWNISLQTHKYLNIP